MRTVERKCVQCGAVFRATGKRVLCSEACVVARRHCQQKSYLARQRAFSAAARPQSVTCAVCGRAFRPGRQGARYCGDPCRKVAERRRNRADCKRSRERRKGLQP